MERISFDLLKVIKHKNQFIERKLGIVSIRLDREWTPVKEYRLKYWATWIIVRWPFALMLRLDVTHYFTGGFLKPHRDQDHPKVRQINSIFVLKKPIQGGELKSEKFIYKGKRLRIIKPLLYTHEVTPIKEGERRVLNLSIRYAKTALNSPPF